MPKPQPRERQFIVDYIANTYPQHRVKMNCPLGLPPTKLVANFGMNTALKMGIGSRLMCDALVWEENRLILIEAKIREWVNGIAKLPVYKLLIKSTPELREYWAWPVDMICVLPFTNDYIEDLAQLMGVKVVVYTSDAVTQSMEQLNKWHSKEWRNERRRDRETAERLGLNV